MTEARPIASLSPTLLARKGGARPVLRSQLQNTDSHADATGDDRLGAVCASADGPDPVTTAEIVSLTPSIARSVPARPAVRVEREKLENRLSRHAPKPRRPALVEGRAAAFTLRLDADRHLHLRLACALTNRSAQSLVTEALDQLLASLPEVADLAKRAGKRR